MSTSRESQAAACQDGYLSSGPSPTRVHVLGLGAVGRALLRRWDPGWRLVCVSDRSGSAYSAAGLDPRHVERRKAEGVPVARLAEGRALPLSTVLRTVDCDLVVDSRSTEADRTFAAAQRAFSIARRGQALVFAAKDALARCHVRLERDGVPFGLNAVLGGTGASLQRELPALRQEVRSLECVPNASSTALLHALGEGLGLEAACARARSAGVLESDPRQDLDGTDAALKLAVVVGLLERRFVDWREIPRPQLGEVDPRWVREVAQSGGAVRLVGRWIRGQQPTLAFEAVARGSLRETDAGCVVYAYHREDGRRRVHLGRGLGPEGTAAAVAADLRRLSLQGVPA